MRTDALLEEIVRSSQIPSGKERQDVLRELRAHVEDFRLDARAAGHSDDEIERQIAARFGDPRQIADGFRWVYRYERARLRVAVFVSSVLALAGMLAAAVFPVQAGVAAGFGIPVRYILGSRHTLIEGLDMLSTVAAYVALITIEKLFDRRGFLKATVLLGFAVAAAVASLHAPYLTFGFAGAVFFRLMQIFLKARTARTGVAAVCFAAAGLGMYAPHSMTPAFLMSCISWLAMGAAFQLMADLATRVEAKLSAVMEGAFA